MRFRLECPISDQSSQEFAVGELPLPRPQLDQESCCTGSGVSFPFLLGGHCAFQTGTKAV